MQTEEGDGKKWGREKVVEGWQGWLKADWGETLSLFLAVLPCCRVPTLTAISECCWCRLSRIKECEMISVNEQQLVLAGMSANRCYILHFFSSFTTSSFNPVFLIWSGCVYMRVSTLSTSMDWLLSDEPEESGAIPSAIRQQSQWHMTPFLIIQANEHTCTHSCTQNQLNHLHICKL